MEPCGRYVHAFYQLPVKLEALPEHKTWEFLAILRHIPVGDVRQIIHDFLFFRRKIKTFAVVMKRLSLWKEQTKLSMISSCVPVSVEKKNRRLHSANILLRYRWKKSKTVVGPDFREQGSCWI